jgi:ribonuclease VapC
VTLDSSALIAILFGEAGYLELVDLILDANAVRAGTPTLTETAIVMTARRRTSGARELASLLEELDVTAVSFGPAHHDAAVRAFEKYGRGRHKAALNFGDCLSYAVAKVAGDSLLFVGGDFAHTDIRPAR